MGDRTELQQDIIAEHRRNTSKSDADIASKLDCSASYVNQVRNEYDEESGSGGLLWLLILAGIVVFALAEAGAI